jgi:catechol 2,3-dioxygenase-like lactoylglutathione lyase family enzyme
MLNFSKLPFFPHAVKISTDERHASTPRASTGPVAYRPQPVMSSLRSTSLIVRDVAKAVAFFQQVTGLQVLQQFDSFAELEGRKIRIMLNTAPTDDVPTAAGIILHFEEENIAAAAWRAESYGTTVIKGPIHTAWGTESVWVQGPEGIIIDFYRNT